MGKLILDDYLGALVDNVVKFLAENPKKRETFLISTYKNEIEFNALLPRKADPVEVKFRDGVLCIHSSKDDFGMLPKKTGENFASLMK